jgi:hypothetical protein
MAKFASVVLRAVGHLQTDRGIHFIAAHSEPSHPLTGWLEGMLLTEWLIGHLVES